MKRFLLYDEALEALKESGLEERLAEHLEEAEEQEKPEMRREHHLGVRDARNRLEDLKEYIWEDVRPENFTEHKRNVKMAIGQPQKHPWVIHAQPTYEIESDPSDVVALEGVYLRELFTPKNFWNHQEYGFANHHALHGALSIRREEQAGRQPDVTWRDENKETRIDSTGYFSITQVDRTEHEVTAPTGAQVPFKPLRSEDHTHIEIPYKQELPLLVSALIYLDQTRTGLPRATKNRIKKEIRSIDLDQDNQQRILKAYFNGRENNIPGEPGFENPHQLFDRDQRGHELLATDDELIIHQGLFYQQGRPYMSFKREDVATLANALIKRNLNLRDDVQVTATRSVLAYHHLVPY